MKKLLLFLMCLSFQLYPFADGTIVGGDDSPINMLYGIVDIEDLMPQMNYYDMIIT